jgi:flagellar FliJ protein
VRLILSRRIDYLRCLPHKASYFAGHHIMKHRDKLLTRVRHEVSTKAQSIAAINAALQDMGAIVVALDRRVSAEEARSRVTDLKHVAYSTVARAARVRSNNLKQSVTALEVRLVAATADHESALAKLAALENQEAARFIQLPLRDTASTRPQRRERRLRVYPLRAVNVAAPSNDNLASTGSTATAAISSAQ